MARPQTPAGFVTVERGVYISITQPRAAALDSNDSAPNVIIIFGWMGALTRHLELYARKYAELYPDATRIIVTCGPAAFWTPTRMRENRLIPVVEALEALGCLPSSSGTVHSRSRVLVHSFSNGGGFQMMTLGRLLAAKYPSITPSGCLASALVFDSAPSISDFRSIHMAFNIAIRNPVVRYIALLLIYIVHASRLFFQTVFGREMLSTRYYKTLLQPQIFPWMSIQTPRLYIYSKRDDMVPWQQVERHAETAKAAGLTVRCEVYDTSAHVAHMRLDPNRYWTSVQELCKAAFHSSQLGTVVIS